MDDHTARLNSGRDYLSSLNDGRKVILANEVIDDIASYPATGAMAASIGELLDAHHDDRRLLDSNGLPWAYSPALTYSDVASRGRAFEAIARMSGGLLGRSPDFLGTILTAWAAAADSFGEYAENVTRYWARCRAENTVLTHAISDPPGDRYLPAAQTAQAAQAPAATPAAVPQTLRLVGEQSAGIIVSGAKMLATLAPFANELLIYPYRPLRETEADLALCFAIPVAAEGLTLFCRPSLATGSVLDHPFAGRFDELDAICVFDNVLVPWERVFICRDTTAANRLRENTGMTAYAWHQSSVRAWIKAALIFALAQACADAGGRKAQDATRQQLGELAGIAETLRALVASAENGARQDSRGYYVCDHAPLAAAAMINSNLYPRAVELLQLVSSSGLIMHPLAADEDPAAHSHDFFGRYFAGDGVTASEHGRLLRAAAELALDKFGARQVLYERVFVGPPDAFRAKFYDIYDHAGRGDDEMLRLLMEAK